MADFTYTTYAADDEVESVIAFEDEVEEVAGNVYEDLQEAAVRAQRLVVSRLQGEYRDGRLMVTQADIERRNTPEKMFNIPKYIEWVDGEPTAIIDSLIQGRLRCRVGAKAGLGKSTKLPFKIAVALNQRVLHVALDSRAMQQASDFVRARGIGRYTSRWRGEQCAAVSCITYGDFCGHMFSARRVELFRCFDTIIFDEGFVENKQVFTAKRCFAAYAPAHTNLLVCSATVTTEKVEGRGESSALGNVKVIDRLITVSEAISSGRLFSDYLVDKTLVLAPNNAAVYDLKEAYEDVGVEVMMLDDASDHSDVLEVTKRFEGDSTTPRVVVAHSLYGIAFNFPVQYVIKFPQEVEYVVNDSSITEHFYSSSSEGVLQAISRAGRGIEGVANAVVMSPDRDDASVLRPSERIGAFVYLCAAYITPMRNDFWAKAYELFPEGLTASLAQNILKVCLPVEVAVRYLSSDGRYAASYYRALNAFTQPDHYLMPSKDGMPINMGAWVTEPLYGARSVTVKVPFHADGELQVIMHAIEMMRSGDISVERWRPVKHFSMGEGYDSDDGEGYKVAARQNKTNLRLIADKNLAVMPPAPEIKPIPWSYKADGVEYGRRRGGIVDSDRVRAALREFSSLVDQYRIPDVKIDNIVETEDGAVTPILQDGNIESPGGSAICALPVKICEKMNRGQTLTSSEFVTFMTAIRRERDRVIQSKLFDALAGPWDSVMDSLMDDSVVDSIITRGLSVDTYQFVDGLRARFSVDLKSILANSNVFKVTYWGIFKRKPTLDDIMRAVRKGKFDGIAQTDGYINRVKRMKEKIDQVLLRAERSNVYLPGYITNAQRSLPLRGDPVLGYVGHGGMIRQPKGAKMLHTSLNDDDSTSVYSFRRGH